MMSSAEQTVRDTRRAWRKDRSQIVHSPIYPLLYPLNSFTEKDFFVVFILTHASGNKYDPASRIVPALLFQPHFPNRVYEKHNTEDGKRSILFYGQYKEIRKSPLFTGFKYIKTFTPMLRRLRFHKGLGLSQQAIFVFRGRGPPKSKIRQWVLTGCACNNYPFLRLSPLLILQFSRKQMAMDKEMG